MESQDATAATTADATSADQSTTTAAEHAAATSEPKADASTGETLLTGKQEADPAAASAEVKEPAKTEQDAAKPADQGKKAAKPESGNKKVDPEAKKADEEPGKVEEAEKKPEDPDTDADAPDWRDLATDEKKRNRLNKYNSVDEVAEALLAADQRLRSMVEIPGKNSTPEAVARFRKLAGVPETPDGYDLEVEKGADESVKERVDRLRMAAHGVNLSQAQLEALTGWHEAEAEADAAREAQRHEQAVAQLKTDLSREWGPDFHRNVAASNQAAAWMFGDFAGDFLNMELADGTKVANHPIVMRALSKVGRSRGEAGIPGSSIPDNWTPNRAELEAMMADPKYRDPAQRDANWVKQVEVGFQRLYGGGSQR